MNRRRRTRYKDAYNAASKFKEAEFGEESLRRIATPLPQDAYGGRGGSKPSPGYEFTEDNKLIKSGGTPLPQDAYGGRGGSKP
tara:strand:- start:233 stop:481 length:249 start_codon:yes stop_codon:yes gene_type:complete